MANRFVVKSRDGRSELSGTTLFVRLNAGRELLLAKSFTPGNKRMTLDGVDFNAITIEWHGFYDWLWDESGAIAGVMTLFSEEASILRPRLNDSPVARWSGEASLEIRWDDGEVALPANRGDQDFTLNRIFEGEDRALVAAFQSVCLHQPIFGTERLRLRSGPSWVARKVEIR